MDVQERQEQIVSLVQENRRIQVKRLAELLEVSEKTIRRDLAKLEGKGLIGHIHGTAVLGHEILYSEKSSSNHSVKCAIANRALGLIEDGDTIFLDAGTTTFELAKLLKKKMGLTVVTNDIKIAHYLFATTDFSIMMCGGRLQSETGATSGIFANNMMGYLEINASFMGAASISSSFYVLTPSMDKVQLKNTVISNSEVSYLLVDDSKFSNRALLKINHLSAYTAVITNKSFAPIEKKKLDTQDVTLFQVDVPVVKEA